MGIEGITFAGHPVKKITINGGIWWEKAGSGTYTPILPDDTSTYPQTKYDDVLSFAVRHGNKYGYYVPKTGAFTEDVGMTGTDMLMKRDGKFWQYYNKWDSSYFTSKTQNGLTLTVNADDSITLIGTPTANTYQIVGPAELSVAGHKYYIDANFDADVSAGANAVYVGLRNGTGFQCANSKGGRIVSVDSGYYNGSLVVRVAGNYALPNDGVTTLPDIFDLTEIFGAGREPTISNLKTIFDGFYDVDMGSALTMGGNPFYPEELEEI